MRGQIRDLATSILLAASFAGVFQTAAFATYYIPSESMVPTLEVGDRLAASKYAYGFGRYSLPFGLSLPATVNGRVLAKPPSRGDIAIFMHPRTGERMIKRVVGVAGDRIALRGTRLWLNGKPVSRHFERLYTYRDQQGALATVALYTETLPGGRQHSIIERTGHAWRHDMGEIVIPPGRYFMMGDNRDNSADSRYPDMGLVPEENLVGRAETILYSFHTCDEEPGVTCAGRRFATRLH